jgi:ribonuclease-3
LSKAVERIAASTGYRFTDESLLTRALTHRSANHHSHNERLEFLGDSLLNFLVAEMVYLQRGSDDEGDLSRLRSSLVRGATLADIAAEIELGSCLILGTGELKSGGHRRRSILADGLEALLGAIYLDGGLPAATQVVQRLFAQRLVELPDASLLKDPKTRLQEWLQARGMALPEYEIVEVSGQEHAQQFTVCCRLTRPALEFLGQGPGRRQAEQQAATSALETLLQDHDGRH